MGDSLNKIIKSFESKGDSIFAPLSSKELTKLEGKVKREVLNQQAKVKTVAKRGEDQKVVKDKLKKYKAFMSSLKSFQKGF